MSTSQTNIVQNNLVHTEFEIKIQTKDFNRALSLLNSAVEKKNIIPVLANFKLSAGDNYLTITATDMDLSIAEQVYAQIIKPGELTVSARIVNEIVKHMTDETITLKFVNNLSQLIILGVDCEFSLSTLPAHDFPTLDQIDATAEFKISAEHIIKLIENTKFSISSEETRYNLNGIFFHSFVKEKIRYFAAASTDGHRLSLAYTVAPADMGDFGIIIPKKAALELQKILRDNQSIEHDVKIELSAVKVKFTCNKVTLISKLIDGNFPDYKAFIPLSNSNKLTIHTKQFLSAINRVSTITLEKFRAIKLNISAKGVEFSAFGEARGSAREYLTANSVSNDTVSNDKVVKKNEKNNKQSDKQDILIYEGEDNLLVGFNPKYITDVLDTVKGRAVVVELKDSFSPALIRDANDDSALFVIMPIKV